MGVNITVDGLTYSGVEQMYVGGKSLALSASFPGAVDIDTIALRELTEAIGSASIVGSYAFAQMTDLSIVSFANASTIEYYAFNNCIGLTSVYVPNATYIGSNAFAVCTLLEEIDLPSATTIGANCFMWCSELKRISVPLLGSVTGSCFGQCYNLSILSLPNVFFIYNNAFRNAFGLLSINFMSSSVAVLSNSNAFGSTPIAGYTASTGGVLGSIYVPASLLTAYQSATNWAFFSERFVGV